MSGLREERVFANELAKGIGHVWVAEVKAGWRKVEDGSEILIAVVPGLRPLRGRSRASSLPQ